MVLDHRRYQQVHNIRIIANLDMGDLKPTSVLPGDTFQRCEEASSL
jgi:hypothetical protein